MEKYRSILEKYLPQGTVIIMMQWLQEHKVQLRITRGRASKLGDYRAPHDGKGHQISVNHNLNQYAFLITLVHELAHLVSWERYKNRVKPHGREWKQIYREMMQPLMEMNVFPDDLQQALKVYLNKSYASSSTDLGLSRTLQRYDEHPSMKLEDLEEGCIFTLHNGRKFRKGPLLRKRYRCPSLDNNRIYLINPLAEVVPVASEH